MRRSAAVVVSLGVAALGFAALGVAENSRGVGAGDGPRIFEYSIDLAVPGREGWDYGSIQLYAAHIPGMDTNAVIAEGTTAMLARFPGAVLLEPGEVSAQFKLFPTPVRWAEPGTSWLYNPEGGTPAMPAVSAQEAITQGADGWDDAGGSGWQFDYLGTTTTATGCNGDTSAYVRDGKNVVGWGHIAGGHLGYSCHWRSASLVEGTPYFAIQEFDIIFEPTFPYSAQSLRALALHEFGHALGLDHAEPPACPGKAMCAGGAAMQFISPQQDDIFGVIALYGVAAEPTPAPPTPVAPTVPPGARPYRAIGAGLARD